MSCPGFYINAFISMSSVQAQDQINLNTILATSRYDSLLCVGLMEYVPQKLAGIRTEPPVDVFSRSGWQKDGLRNRNQYLYPGLLKHLSVLEGPPLLCLGSASRSARLCPCSDDDIPPDEPPHERS